VFKEYKEYKSFIYTVVRVEMCNKIFTL